MAKRKEIKTEQIEGSFLGITPPELDLIKVALLHKTVVTTQVKDKLELSRENNYTISIDVKNISSSQYSELSENLKVAFKMNWAPFNWDMKRYDYYTSKWTGDDEFKKEQLQKIFTILKDFETEYKITQAESLKEYQKDTIEEDYPEYKDKYILVRYHKEMKSIIVVALGFLDTEKFRLLAQASKSKGRLEENPEFDTSFVMDAVTGKNKNKSYFIINPYDYQNLKEHIEQRKTEKMIFLEEQTQVAQQYADNFILYEEKNPFDFKIRFDNEKKCFEFYCKGYSSPKPDPRFRSFQERSILSKWALNFILAGEVTPDASPEIMNEYIREDDIDFPHYYKHNLHLVEDSARKELWVPADQWQKLTQMHERFQEQMQYFGRPEKSIKIHDNDFLSRSVPGVNLKEYPAIYFDDKGKAFLLYSYRNMRTRAIYDKETEEIIGEKEGKITMKGIEVSFDEVNMFFNNHDFAENIHKNSIYLNSEIWMQKSGENLLLNEQERIETFDTIFLHAKLAHEAKDKKKATTKRVKI